MPYAAYISKTFTPAHQRIIDQGTEICETYAADGMVLTLRQLYYQFVARDLIANKQSEYKRLSDIFNDARMAGQFDWEFLIDRTRGVRSRTHHKSPKELIEAAAKSYLPDLWEGQHKYVEVWIEKDAAIGVIEGVCRANDIGYFAMRGYSSVSSLWEAANRLRFKIEDGDQVTVLHIGDHDPSGIDMTRDINDRLRRFIHEDWMLMHEGVSASGLSRGTVYASMREHIRSKGSTIGDAKAPWKIKRIALNMDQVERYNPPPNPAKLTDARAQDYIAQYGDSSWELDALEPRVLQNLILDEIELVRDEELWADAEEAMLAQRATLRSVAEHWDAVATAHAPKGL